MNNPAPIEDSGIAPPPGGGGGDAGVPPPAMECHTGFESAEGLASAWDAAVERLHGPPYMLFDWLRQWWRHYGGEGFVRS